jgi:hypothetical protein
MFRYRSFFPAPCSNRSIWNYRSRHYGFCCNNHLNQFFEFRYIQVKGALFSGGKVFTVTGNLLNRASPNAPQIRSSSSMSLRERINAAMTNYLLENSPAEKKVKKDERKERVLEKLKSASGLELLENFQNYVLFETVDEANSWALKVLNELKERVSTDTDSSPEPLYIGLHVGWNCYGSKREKKVTHVISISFPNQPVACLSLYRMGVRDHTTFPENVRTLLELPYIKVCGILIHRFLSRIKRYFHVIVPTRIELDKFSMIIEPQSIKEAMRRDFAGYLEILADKDKNKKQLPSMKVLCSKYLNVEIDGTIGKPHTLDYFQDPLPAKIIKYSALYAYHCRCLGETMINAMENDITLPQPSTKFQVGTKVKVYIGSKVDHVAEGIIEYLGGVNGESVGFGEKMINHGMSLVRLTEVRKWEKNPKYVKETFMLYGFQWTRDATLGSVFLSKLPLIPIDLKRLVRIDEVDSNLHVEKPKKPKKLSPRKIKDRKKRRLRRKQELLESADFEAKMGNTYWNF